MSNRAKLIAVLALLAAAAALPASAQLYPYNSQAGQRIRTDSGFAIDRSFIGHESIIGATASATYCATNLAPSTAPVTIYAASLTKQPDIPRAIVLTPAGTTNDIATGNVTITGTDIAGNTITEAVAFLANATAAKTTDRAFASIASIAFATQDGTAARFNVGVANKFGLKHTFSDDAFFLVGLFNGTDELSSATKQVNSTVLSRNTYQTAGTCDGVKPIDVYYLIK